MGVNDTDAVNLGQMNAAIAAIGSGDTTALQAEIDAINAKLASSAPALGNNASAGSEAVAIGDGAAAGDNAVSIGKGNSATGTGAVAIGDPNVATGQGAVAIGNDNTATGEGAVALGDNSTANGLGAVALGNNSAATGEGAVAIGDASIAGTNGVALGNGATTGAFTNSVALGAGSAATANNQVNVGGRTVGGVAAGAVTATSTDAVNGSQLYATNQAIAAIGTNVAGLQGQIDDLVDTQKSDRREARRGVAAAVAMSDAPMPSRDGGVSYSLHGATYRGQYALGGSLKYRINRSVAVDAGVSYAGSKETAVRAGFSGEF